METHKMFEWNGLFNFFTIINQLKINLWTSVAHGSSMMESRKKRKMPNSKYFWHMTRDVDDDDDDDNGKLKINSGNSVEF